ncbi:MAG: choline dehydrogenase [Leptospiraceae bacterium]|nr:choline dehydrogenase [Leptospiraceae bacterium]
MSQKNNEYDYILVGSGSAGSVLAARLSEDPDVQVLVLEAGGSDSHIFSRMPAAFSEPLKGKGLNWAYYTVPDPYMDNRRMYCPRGKILGGSGSVNGMVYIRGNARDYDRWAGYGLESWSAARCLPYFRRVQDHAEGADEYRGSGGPQHVDSGRQQNPLFSAWLKAGVEAGYQSTTDVNGFNQEGIGPFDRTTRNGYRHSSCRAYLHPAKKRPNLHIKTRAFVRRILLEGSQATGVVLGRSADQEIIRARREVILCAGAINSPTILQHSGIGDPDHLQQVGVTLQHSLPGVGANLQDHLETYVQYACLQPITLYPSVRWYGRIKVGLQWIFFKTGDGATNHFEAGGFIRSAAGVEHPDLQFHFLPIAMNYDGTMPAGKHGFQVHVGPMRPTSRGSVRINSTDPRQHPDILFNYMSTEQDRKEMRAAIRLTREIVAQPAFAAFRGAELKPGIDVQSDAEIDAFIRSHAESAYHPSCSCKMGLASDPMAVVDEAGLVHGLSGLRVVDTSIMPDLVSGNTDAPTIMMAEKISDVIRGRPPLPESEAPFYVHPAWQSQQR